MTYWGGTAQRVASVDEGVGDALPEERYIRDRGGVGQEERGSRRKIGTRGICPSLRKGGRSNQAGGERSERGGCPERRAVVVGCICGLRQGYHG